MQLFGIISTAVVAVLVFGIVGGALYRSLSRTSRAHRCSMCPYSSECGNKDVKKCAKH